MIRIKKYTEAIAKAVGLEGKMADAWSAGEGEAGLNDLYALGNILREALALKITGESQGKDGN